MDIHVTDGEDYQYDITYGWAGYEGDFARSKATSAWLDKTYLPATQAGLKAAGHIPGQLVFALDDRDLEEGPGLFAGVPALFQRLWRRRRDRHRAGREPSR